jgi:general secretion pathway protein H
MTRLRRNIRTGDAGFTLLELIAAMTILALAAVWVAPAGDRTRRSLSIEATTLKLAAALKAARSQAVRSNQEQKLVIDLEQRRYWAEGLGGAKALPADIAVTYEVPASEQSKPGTAVLRFRPDGSSSGGNVRLKTTRRSANLTVDWLTGGTHIEWER